jgi:hypothetical protein
MPNPLGRRRDVSGSPSAEIDQLKAELAELRSAYVQDMKNISADMSNLNEKIEPATPVDTEVVS